MILTFNFEKTFVLNIFGDIIISALSEAKL